MGRFGRFARRRGKWILAGGLVLGFFCLWVVPRLEIETQPVRLFPRAEPTVDDLQYFAQNFGISDLLLILVDGSQAELGARLDDLVTRLRGSGHFTAVERRELPGADGRVLLLAFPRENAMNQWFCRTMVGDVRRHLSEAGVRAELTGPPLYVIESREAFGRDLQRSGLLAVILVTGLVVFFYGDPVLPLFGAVPLGLGIMWTLGFAWLAFGRINLLTASLPTTLIGMGIDYAMYLRSARLEHAGEPPLSAWQHIFARIGAPLTVGMLTAVAAFFALLSARMRALSQFGLAGGVGLLLIFIATVMLAPALIDWRDRLRVGFRPVSMEWLARFARRAARRRWWTMGAFALVTLPLAFFASQVRISSEPTDYQDPGLVSVRVQIALAQRLNVTLDPVLIATRNPAAERRVREKVKQFVGPDKVFARLDCLTGYVDRVIPPSMSVLVGDERDVARQFAASQIFVGKDNRLCMILYPKAGLEKGDTLAKVAAAVGAIRREAGRDIERIAGGPLIYNRLLDLIRDDLLRTAPVAAAAVFLMLALLIRRLGFFFAAVVPLVGGLTWMFGILVLMGQPITAANAIAMPLVVGLGVDYAVHVVHRLRRVSVETAMRTTGLAILVASTTTIAGFLTLCLAGNPAIAGMGLAAGIGITTCLTWTLFFLPALVGRSDGGSAAPGAS